MQDRLLPFQRTGRAWLLSTNDLRGHLLADQPGLGKTVQAASALKDTFTANILVLCPSIMREKWAAELKKWANRDSYFITPTHAPEHKAGTVAIASHALMSYPKKKGSNAILTRNWGLVIADEAHVFKEPTSTRTRTFYTRLLRRAKHTWLLTGTPALNHAAELYTHLAHFVPGSLWSDERGATMTYEEFVEKYCLWRDTVYGRQITGSKNGAHLRTILNDTGFMLRRMVKDVLPDLPDVRITSTTLSPAEVKTDWHRVADQAASDDGAAISARHELALIRLPAVVAYAAELLENDPQARLLVFGLHHDVLDVLVSKLGMGMPVKIDGRDSDKKRQERIRTFQNDPACRVFVGQIEACGVGIDLTRATNVLMAEPHPSPEKNLQAILRARRIGTQHPVLAEFLALPIGADRRIQQALAQKTKGLYDIFY